MVKEYLQAMFLIFMAEMGDKTQILAMAFATQYKTRQVLLGVLIGSFLNHGIAVAVGAYLSNLIPINTIQIIAGFAFIAFALWTLKNEKDEDEEIRNKFGPIITVALAFFIGELGDKTQLTAITLSTDAVFPIFILLGTVSGMILTSGVGIFIGSKLGDRIPELTIKIVSAAIFLFFGFIKLLNTLPSNLLTPVNIMVFMIILGLSIYITLIPRIKAKKEGRSTVLQEVALTLYRYKHHLKENIDRICLGEGHCGKCQGQYCVIGYTKGLLEDNPHIEEPKFSSSINKDFKEEEVINGLAISLIYLNEAENIDDKDKEIINRVRLSLERILFNRELIFKNLSTYLSQIKDINPNITVKIMERVNELKK